MVVNFSDYSNLRSVQTNPVNNLAFNKKFPLNFCGLKTLDRDTVELSFTEIKNNEKISEKPQYPLTVKIKDAQGNNVDAVINDITPKPTYDKRQLLSKKEILDDEERRKDILSGTSDEKYLKNSTKVLELTVDDKQIAGISFHPNDNCIYVEYLYNNKLGLGYKGAGTELLKCAVKESIANNFGGVVELHAQQNGTNTPLPFYYKNNFSFKPDNVVKEALTLYTIQNKIPSNQVFGPSDGSADMIIDEEGAKALLDGKRLYKDKKLEKIDETIIKDNRDNIYNCSSYLFDNKRGNEKCVIVISEDEFGDKYYLPVKLEIVSSKETKHFVITNIPYSNFGGRNMRKNGLCMAIESIEKLEQKYNYDKTTVKDEYIQEKIREASSKQIDVE